MKTISATAELEALHETLSDARLIEANPVTKLTINQVLEGRVAYARDQTEVLARRAASLVERASRCVARGDFRGAATAAKEAEIASAEAHMWEECSQALLTPIAIYLRSKA